MYGVLAGLATEWMAGYMDVLTNTWACSWWGDGSDMCDGVCRVEGMYD